MESLRKLLELVERKRKLPETIEKIQAMHFNLSEQEHAANSVSTNLSGREDIERGRLEDEILAALKLLIKGPFSITLVDFVLGKLKNKAMKDSLKKDLFLTGLRELADKAGYPSKDINA